MLEQSTENAVRLYHGTSEARLHQILREGIRPRRETERGNFEGETRSIAGHTYLTGPCGLFYAEAASPAIFVEGGRISKRNSKRVVIEVDPYLLGPSNMRPDEDALHEYLHNVASLNDEALQRKHLSPNPNDQHRQLLREIIGVIPGGETFVTTDMEQMRKLWT